MRRWMGIAALTLALTGCIEQKEPLLEAFEHNDYSAETTVEYTKRGGTNFPVAKQLDFSAEKTGTYLIEGWGEVYRKRDRLDHLEIIYVDSLPFEKSIDFSSDVYRIEITYSDGTTMNRSTIALPVK